MEGEQQPSGVTALPNSVTTQVLWDVLKLSPQQRREIVALLSKATPEFWPRKIESEEEFYELLRSYLERSDYREIFDGAAARVEKKKKRIRLDLAFYRATVDRHNNNEEFREERKRCQSKPDGILSIVKWLLANDEIDEAVNLAWSFSAYVYDQIRALCEQEPALGDRLLPILDVCREGRRDESSLDEGQSLDWSSGVHLLKRTVETLDQDRVDLASIRKVRKTSQSLEQIAETSLEDRVLHADELEASRTEAITLLESLEFRLVHTDPVQIDDPIELRQAQEELAATLLRLQQACEHCEIARRQLDESAGAGEQERAIAALSRAAGERRDSASDLRQALASLGVTLASADESNDSVLPNDSEAIDTAASSAEAPEPSVVGGSDQGTASDTSARDVANQLATPGKGKVSDRTKLTEPSRSPDHGEGRESETQAPSAEEGQLGGELVEEAVPREASAINRLLLLVRRGDLASAYWLAWAIQKNGCATPIEPDALGAAAESLFSRPFGMGPSQGAPEAIYAAGRAYRVFLERVAETELDNRHSLIAGCAVLPVALFAREKPSQIYQLASTVRTGIRSFDELFRNVMESFVYRGIAVGSPDIRSVSLQSADEDAIEELAARAQQFIDQFPSFTIAYRPAAEGFRALFRQGAPLRRVLTAVAQNSVSDRAWVRAQIDGLEPEELLNEIASGKKYHGRTVDQIQGAARNKILLHLEQVQDIAGEWLSIVESSAGAEASQLREEKQKWLRQINQGIAAAIADLETSDSTEVLQRSAEAAAMFQLKHLQALLSGEPLGGVSSLTQIAAHLAGVRLDAELHPMEDADNLSAIIRSITQEDLPSVESIIQESLDRHEYSRALLLSAAMDDAGGIADTVADAIAEGREALRSELDDVRDQVEEANLLGLLRIGTDEEGSTEISRTFLVAEIESAIRLLERADGNEPINLTRANEVLDAVKETIRDLQSRREQELEEKLSEYLDALKADPKERTEDVRYLTERAALYKRKRDVMALAELVDRARAAVQDAAPLVTTEFDAAENLHLDSYLRDVEDLGRQWNNPRRVAADIQKQKTVSGVPFGDKDRAYCARAAKAFIAWAHLKDLPDDASPRDTADAVITILEFLGIHVDGELKAQAGSKDLVWFTASASTPTVASPIPSFGSDLGSARLNIVVSKVKRSPREIKDFLVRKKLVRAPVLLLQLPAVSGAYRFDFGALAIRHHLSALLVDFSLLLYAAGTREPLRALLAVAMPQMWSQPYLMQGERVPPEMFMGRQKEVNDVLDPDGTCIVYGGRQLGKSALLRHVQGEHHEPSRGLFIVYRDIDDLGTEPQSHQEMEKELWLRIARELEHCGFINKDALPPPNRQAFVESVRTEIRRRLDNSPDTRLIVLLDEADDLVNLDAQWDFNVVKQIRALMAETGRRFKVVFAGLQSIQRFRNYQNHAFAQLGGGTAIRPLPARAAQALVQKPMAALGFRFEYGGLVLRILSETNYHPGLVQIFCYRLLEHLYQTKGQNRKEPFVTIDRGDVAAIERNPDFMEDIRNRFDWTLDLDDRYKVLTYSLVLTEEPTDSLTEEEFLDLGRSWWAAVFEEMDQQTMRALLDEMVGLGVLEKERSEDRRTYRLRSPNLLRLLGPQNEVEAELERLIERPRQRKPNPRNYRRLLSGEPVTFGPLTMEQEAQVAAIPAPLKVCVITGSRALGLDQVGEQIGILLQEVADYEGGEWRELRLSVDQMARGPAAVIEELESALKATKRPHRFAVLPMENIGGQDSPAEFVAQVINQLKQVCKSNSRGCVVILLGDTDTWRWISDPLSRDLTQDERLAVINLRRWSDGAYARSLELVGQRSKAKDRGEVLFDHTDGMFLLGQSVLRRLSKRDSGSWSESEIAEIVDELKKDPKVQVSINDTYLADATRSILEWANDDGRVKWDEVVSLLSEEDSVLEERVFFDGGDNFRRWLQSIGLASPYVKGSAELKISTLIG